MKTSILDFLRMKAQRKLGRLMNNDEENKLYTIASMHEKDLREALRDEVNEFVALTQNCRQCKEEPIETDGLCHICRLCKQNEIEDFKDFAGFYNNTYIDDDTQKIEYYKEQVEQDGCVF